MEMNEYAHEQWSMTSINELEIIFEILLSDQKSKRDEKICSLFNHNLKDIEKIRKDIKHLKKEIHEGDYAIVAHLMHELQEFSRQYRRTLPSSEEEFPHIIKDRRNYNVIYSISDSL